MDPSPPPPPLDDAAAYEAFADRAAGLGYALDGAALARLARFHALLVSGNERAALTRIVTRDDYLERHLLDSLSVIAALAGEPPPGRAIDVGSGAGIPAIPLAVALPGHARLGRPDLAVTAVESEKKKAAFIREAALDLGLGPERLAVYDRRAEDLGRDPAHRDAYDLALARALAHLGVAIELCLPFVRPGGLFVAYKGPKAEAEVAESRAALAALSGEVEAIVPAPLPGRELCLVRIRKRGPTPRRFPRRIGLAAKERL